MKIIKTGRLASALGLQQILFTRTGRVLHLRIPGNCDEEVQLSADG
jgi:hypothetical protein